MKFLFCIPAFLFFLSASGQNKVTVVVDKFENNKGLCRACIFSSAVEFEKMQALKCITTPVINLSAEVIFQDLTDGTYAIFVFHDQNNNGKMDKNFLGIPREGYGASKNKLPFAAAPKFSENSFHLKNSQVNLVIRLRNM